MANNMELAIHSANGMETTIDFESGLTLRAMAQEREKNRAVEVSYAIAKSYEDISKGYIGLCPWIARAIAEKTHTIFVGVPSTNALLIGLTGCSKSWASELVKVCKTFYQSSGELINGWGLFTYTELKKLASYDAEKLEEIRQMVVNSGAQTRDEAKKVLSDWKASQIEDKSVESTATESSSDEPATESSSDEPATESSSDEPATESSSDEPNGGDTNGFVTAAKISQDLTSLVNELRILANPNTKITLTGIRSRLAELVEQYQ